MRHRDGLALAAIDSHMSGSAVPSVACGNSHVSDTGNPMRVPHVWQPPVSCRTPHILSVLHRSAPGKAVSLWGSLVTQANSTLSQSGHDRAAALVAKPTISSARVAPMLLARILTAKYQSFNDSDTLSARPSNRTGGALGNAHVTTVGGDVIGSDALECRHG